MEAHEFKRSFPFLNCRYMMLCFTGNIDLWVERVSVAKLKPQVEYYDEHDPSDSDESNR